MISITNNVYIRITYLENDKQELIMRNIFVYRIRLSSFPVELLKGISLKKNPDVFEWVALRQNAACYGF